MIALVAHAAHEAHEAHEAHAALVAALVAPTGEKITFTLRHIYQRDRSSY